uniref:Copia-type polyprotein n=1 Tax=Solanum tuberosum TaxID=4113 RepID=M1D6V6_SOLTU
MLFLGVQRNNQLLLSRLVKLNTWQRHHAIWFRRLLKELNLPQIEATMICVDNKSTQALAKNPVYCDRSKHIDTRYHFILKCIAKKEVE